MKHRSLTTLREKLVKIAARVVAHSRYVIFHAVPKRPFRTILERIRRQRSRQRGNPTIGDRIMR